MALDKIKRSFQWLRKSLEIIDRTTLPGEILGEVRPTIDTFGWERLNGDVQFENINGALQSSSVFLSAVPEGVTRYVIYASMSHNVPGNITLSFQVRLSIGAIDIGVGGSLKNVPASPFRTSLDRNIVLTAGEQLLARSVPTPGAAEQLFIRYKFIDIAVGEYIPAI